MLSFSKKTQHNTLKINIKIMCLAIQVLALFNAKGMVQKNKKKYQRIAVASLLVYFFM